MGIATDNKSYFDQNMGWLSSSPWFMTKEMHLAAVITQ